MTPALTTTSTSTSAVTKPVQIVIILDASASMEAFDQAAAAAAGQVLQQFLNQTSLNLTLHVVVLGGSGYSANSGNRCHYGTIYNSASPGGDGPADNYGMNAVSANSNTPLADAITYAAGYLNPAIANTAIIMLTDGAETCNGDFQGAVAAEVRAGIRMYAIAYQDKSYDLANFANFTSTVSASDTDAIAAALTTAIATTTTTGATCSP
jgi:hypothetical protein